MEYGLIGEHLTHSFSKEIHEKIAGYTYDLHSIAPDELASFLQSRAFRAVNVTIPYKEKVIPFLDEISPAAREMGAVNVVVVRSGKLCGYNTDYEGFIAMTRHAGISFGGRAVLILGAGGAAKAVQAAARHLGARTVVCATRHPRSADQMPLNDLRDTERFEIIVNATPIGMYPQNDGRIADFGAFSRLEGVLDCVYNPLRTILVQDALERGIPAEGGLYMLVSQAFKAIEIFTDTSLDPAAESRLYADLLMEKTNVVLTGMPSCGKTTVGKQIAEMLHKTFVDTDEEIRSKTGMDIPSFFEQYGEPAFRKVESDVLQEVAKRQNCVVATGGGAVLNPENVARLKQNGRIYFLDRPLELLTPTSDRPLSSDRTALTRRFAERYPIYVRTADAIIRHDGRMQDALDRIVEDLNQLS